MDPTPEEPLDTWTLKIKHKLREPFAEYFGVLTLVVFGDGVGAQVLLSDGKAGEYLSISWLWGTAVMFGVYASGGISGGHLNPAITLSNCIYRKFPWRKLPIYFIAQFLGGLTGAAIIYGNYRSAIDQYEGFGIRTVTPSPTATAGIFCTYPQAFLTKRGQLFSEIIAAAFMQFFIYAIGDENNNPAGGLGPLILCFLFLSIGAALGWETAYALNIARDTAPRLFTWMAGYGLEVWRAGDYYFWVPIVGSIVGSLLGGFLYDLFIFTGKVSPINQPYWGFVSYYQAFLNYKKDRSTRKEGEKVRREELPPKQVGSKQSTINPVYPDAFEGINRPKNAIGHHEDINNQSGDSSSTAAL